MKLNQKFIQQLRNGEIAAENNGTLEQLREVIKAAFPKIYSPHGSYKFYFKDIIHKNEWNAADSTTLPIISITDFYQPQPKPQPKKSNPIHYLVDGAEYSFNYQELKARYEDISQYSDEQFMGNLPEIAHLACVVAYFKGLGAQATISDKGIIHELLHLMTEPNEPTNDLAEIREKFNKLIQLV